MSITLLCEKPDDTPDNHPNTLGTDLHRAAAFACSHARTIFTSGADDKGRGDPARGGGAYGANKKNDWSSFLGHRTRLPGTRAIHVTANRLQNRRLCNVCLEIIER